MSAAYKANPSDCEAQSFKALPPKRPPEPEHQAMPGMDRCQRHFESDPGLSILQPQQGLAVIASATPRAKRSSPFRPVGILEIVAKCDG